MDWLGPLGIKRIRQQTGWFKCEKSAGVYDWAWLDECVDAAIQQGLQPWLETNYGNPMRNSTPWLLPDHPTARPYPWGDFSPLSKPRTNFISSLPSPPTPTPGPGYQPARPHRRPPGHSHREPPGSGEAGTSTPTGSAVRASQSCLDSTGKEPQGSISFPASIKSLFLASARFEKSKSQTEDSMKPNHLCTSPLRTTAIMVLLSSSGLQAAVLLNDTLSDNERATQNLTESAEWAFAPNGGGNTNANLSASTGALVYSPAAAAAQQSTAYFTPSGAPAVLADGETITLTFDFTLTALGSPSENGLRFGLFNSNESRYAPGFGTASPPVLNLAVFEPSTGFFTTANLGATTGTSTFGVRRGNASASNTTPFGGSGTITGASTTSGYLGLSANTTYTASLSITRNTSTSAFVSTTLNGFTQSATTTATAGTMSFDTVAILSGSAIVPTGNTFTVDNIHVSIIPEPASVLLGGLGLFTLLRRRRQPLVGSRS
jgi:hypothetical protein